MNEILDVVARESQMMRPWECWNCSSPNIQSGGDAIAYFPNAGSGDYICGDCGAAGDRKDFE